MIQSLRRLLRKSGPGRARRPWPVFPALLLAAVVPAACVLWFMTEAMRNDRLAAREKLRDLAQTQLESIRTRVDGFWERRREFLSSIESDKPARVCFAEALARGFGDSIVIYDGSGGIQYPDFSLEISSSSEEQRVLRDKAMAVESADVAQGALAWAELAEVARQKSWLDSEARALRNQARCLAKANQKEAAVRILKALTEDSRLSHATDDFGNLLVPNAQVLCLRLMGDIATNQFQSTIDTLANSLRDYEANPFPASQRLFLMQELRSLTGNEVHFPTYEAEKLAAQYAERKLPPSVSATTAAERVFSPSPLAGIWEMSSTNQRVIALFREETIVAETEKFIADERLPDYLKVSLVAPRGKIAESQPLLLLRAGEILQNWQLAMRVRDAHANGFGVRLSVYLWRGTLAVVFVAAIAWASGRSVARQIRLTRLKDDLLATVSHELKTPLASIRALVDTLLAGRCRDSRQMEDYLRMIANENQRLTQLIDNFLSFNRVERGKHQFRFETVDPAALAKQAVAAIEGRLDSSAQLEVAVDSNLPALRGDRDALLTALVNLLDNARKYTPTEKRISLAVSGVNGGVAFAVRDNGIGIDPREIDLIFKRFYQSERSAPGRPGGCGLGLSIVKLIVDAHRGSVEVSSKVGQGSTFCIHLPAGV